MENCIVVDVNCTQNDKDHFISPLSILFIKCSSAVMSWPTLPETGHKNQMFGDAIDVDR